MNQTRPTRLYSWIFVAVSLLALLPMGGAMPVTDQSFFSSVVARIDGGDFAQPSFSPDGEQLAYARVIVHDNIELAEVHVLDINSGRTWTLLDATTSARYATYKASVVRLDWVSTDKLIATISDGDSGATRVTFDVNRRHISSEQTHSDDGSDSTKTDRQLQSVAKLPPWGTAVVRNAFENSVGLQNGNFLIQPFYADVTPDVFHITRQGELTQLTHLPETAVGALCGAVQLNDTVLFLLSESRLGNSRSADLLRFQNGQMEKLGSIATTTEPVLKPLSVNDTRALFFVTTGHSYERSPGALYAYSSAGLTEWSWPEPLYDAVGADTGNLVALVFRTGDRRVIEVRKLL